ncbi:MAG: type II toxin-antitoxin system HicB family antitoxin [Bryobacteraceae bacterium]|jgi:predicted RNase H-like HicB family nuclease
MLTRYIEAAMELAHYEPLEEGGYFGSIPGLDGAWGSGPTLEACRKELAEVLEDWLLFRLSRQMPVPGIQGIELTIREVA